MSASLWVCTTVTLVSAAVSCGYAYLGLRAAHEASHTPSMYALSRSASLLIGALAAVVVRNDDFTAAVAGVMVLVQAFDAVVGAVTKDLVKTVGPAFTVAANAAALVWLIAA